MSILKTMDGVKLLEEFGQNVYVPSINSSVTLHKHSRFLRQVRQSFLGQDDFTVEILQICWSGCSSLEVPRVFLTVI